MGTHSCVLWFPSYTSACPLALSWVNPNCPSFLALWSSSLQLSKTPMLSFSSPSLYDHPESTFKVANSGDDRAYLVCSSFVDSYSSPHHLAYFYFYCPVFSLLQQKVKSGTGLLHHGWDWKSLGVVSATIRVLTAAHSILHWVVVT